MCQVVEEWITIHKEGDIPLPPASPRRDYSGKFIMRVGKEFHRELTICALRERVSLNTCCASVLREGRGTYGTQRVPRAKP